MLDCNEYITLTRRAKDISGERFGMLVALGPIGKNDDNQILWDCRCDCGQRTVVVSGNLQSGNTQSCGCTRKRWSSDLDRFWDKVDKRDAGSCWEWTAYKQGKGYGLIGTANGSARAHRISWRIHNGPIPKGLFVLHRCDNPACVNPDHLFLGTHKDNMSDRQRKKRHAYGTRNGNAKLNPESVRAIRALAQQSISRRIIANIFNIHPDHVKKIVARRAWKHVE